MRSSLKPSRQREEQPQRAIEGCNPTRRWQALKGWLRFAPAIALTLMSQGAVAATITLTFPGFSQPGRVSLTDTTEFGATLTTSDLTRFQEFGALVEFDPNAAPIGTSSTFLPGFETIFYPVVRFEAFLDPFIIAFSSTSFGFIAEPSPDSIAYVPLIPGEPDRFPETQTFIAMHSNGAITLSGAIKKDGVLSVNLLLSFGDPVINGDTSLPSIVGRRLLGAGDVSPISSYGFILEQGQGSIFGSCEGILPDTFGCSVGGILQRGLLVDSDPSSFNVSDPVTPVPVPASGWLLFAALVTLARLRGKSSH